MMKFWKISLSLLVGVVVFLFWNYLYPAHIAYQEQYQMFLFDSDYWWDRVSVPGGLACYVADFLIQFFFHPWVGAIIIALVLVVIQRLMWRLLQQQGVTDLYYPLSFLPLVSLWFFMGDENAMLNFPIALLMAMLAMWGYHRMNSNMSKGFYMLLVTLMLYWSGGSVHFIFVGWVIITECRKVLFNRTYLIGLFTAIVALLLAILCPLMCSTVMQYSWERLLRGLEYYRFPQVYPLIILITGVIVMTLPHLTAYLPKPKKRVLFYGIVECLIISIGSYYLILSGCNFSKEEVLQYDQLTFRGRWMQIIKKAEKKHPNTPFSVVCLNLALAKTGQLGDRMFEFYQNGTGGLLSAFQRDFTAPLPTSEAYYHLGMINTAQRFTFEAMESIPNYRKSSRAFRRLAETNLINGQYEVAAKYLRALQKTLYYKRWAENAMTYLYDEERINAHKEWGWLRQIRYEEDFLFSDAEVPIMLGMLFQRNYKNKMAYEYMMAYLLLQGDLQHFMQYYPIGQHADYDHIPRSYQEALVYMWTQNNSSFEGMPWSISKPIMNMAADFAKIYASQPNHGLPLLTAKYKDSYWYYLLCRNS